MVSKIILFKYFICNVRYCNTFPPIFHYTYYILLRFYTKMFRIGAKTKLGSGNWKHIHFNLASVGYKSSKPKQLTATGGPIMLNAADNQYDGEEKKTFPRNKDVFLHSTMYVFISNLISVSTSNLAKSINKHTASTDKYDTILCVFIHNGTITGTWNVSANLSQCLFFFFFCIKLTP